MKTIKIIKILGIIGLLFLLPSISNAQIQRVWNIAEYTSTMLPPPPTGTKVAYRTLNNSLYYWDGTQWKRIAGPGIVDTTYSLSFSSPTLSLLGSGSSVSLTNLYTAGYGLIKTAETWRADTTSPNGLATRLFTNRFALGTGTTDRSARWSGTNTLAAGNITDNGTKLEALLPWQFQSVTTAGRPTGVSAYIIDNSTNDWFERYSTVAGAWISPAQTNTAGGKFTANYFPHADANGRLQTSSFYQSGTNAVIGLTGGLQIPSGTSAQQSTTGAGYLRWNTSLGYPTIFNGSVTQSVLIGPFTGFASGELLYGAATGGMPTSNANFKWDITNNRLLIGTASYGFASSTKLVVQQSTASGIIADFRQTSVTAFAPLVIMKLTRTDNTVGYGGTFAFYFNNSASSEVDYARFGSYIESNTSGSHGGGLVFYTTNAGTSNQERLRVTSIGRLGLNTTTPTHRLHVNGRARIDTTDATPTSLLGVDGNNVLGKSNLGWGLSMSGGALSTTYPYRLIREDTTISEVRMAKTGGSTNMYLRLGDANSQFTRLIMRGEDANYPAGTIYAETTGGILYTHGFEVDNISVVGGTAKTNVKYIYDDGVATSFFHEANSLILDTYRKVEYRKGRVRTGENYAFRALFSVADTSNSYTSLYNINDNSNTSKYFTKRLFDLTVSGYNTYFYVNKRGDLVLNDSLNRVFSITNGTVKASAYGTGTKEASDLSKTQSAYIAGFATDGTLLDYPISSLGNGIYGGSATLSQHTTRARIPSTGNLLFSQTYNSTDSAYIQVINNLDGNREVRGGLTDTASTGFSKFRFYQDEPNEEMGWEILTDDGTGTTAVGGQGGNLSLYADAAGTVEVRGQELRLNNGEVSMNQYGQGNMKASDLSATDSKFVAKFGDAGKVLDYYLARDTFIEDVTLFSVGTLMNDCQELTVVSSMTSIAPTNQEIRFPDAADYLRGKKIIVYSKKKDAGAYVPYISVVGGVSRLYYTTNPAVGGTDPSSQATLYIDDGTWSDHGTTFEFTCLKIDNTPSYRWVLKQR